MTETKGLVERLKENHIKGIGKGIVFGAGIASISIILQTGTIMIPYWTSTSYPPQWIDGKILSMDYIPETVSGASPTQPPEPGQYVTIEGIKTPVTFSSENWDKTLQTGASVTAVVKENLLQGHLTGMYVRRRE